MNKRAEFVAGLEQSAFWMPYTANRQFKKAPRLLARAEGMYYWTPEGRKVLDGCGGVWGGGFPYNRKSSGRGGGGVAHPPHPPGRAPTPSSRARPAHGAAPAADGGRVCRRPDPWTTPAVIGGPAAGSTGVLAPPQG